METVKAVVERADTSTTADVLLSVMKTSGVAEYALPKVSVQAEALVPVVMSPVTSLELAPMVGLPVPQEDMVGAGLVEEAVRWPY